MNRIIRSKASTNIVSPASTTATATTDATGPVDISVNQFKQQQDQQQQSLKHNTQTVEEWTALGHYRTATLRYLQALLRFGDTHRVGGRNESGGAVTVGTESKEQSLQLILEDCPSIVQPLSIECKNRKELLERLYYLHKEMSLMVKQWLVSEEDE